MVGSLCELLMQGLVLRNRLESLFHSLNIVSVPHGDIGRVTGLLESIPSELATGERGFRELLEVRGPGILVFLVVFAHFFQKTDEKRPARAPDLPLTGREGLA